MIQPVKHLCRHGRPAFSARQRCRHSEDPPPGFIACAGDPGCEVRLPDRSGDPLGRVQQRLCPYHRDANAIRLIHIDWYHELMKEKV